MSAAAGQHLSDFGIGASEIAAVVGLSPYRSRYELWLEKIGEREPFAGNDNTEWGLLVEPAARKAYEMKTGQRVHVPSGSLFHPTLPFARATPDGVIVDSSEDKPTDPARWRHLLQLKNTGYWPGKSWDQGPPDFVVLQEQWELFVAGAVALAAGAAEPIARADVAASIGGGFPDFFTVHRDDKMIADLVVAAERFWHQVETRTPPPVDDSEECRRYWLKRARAGADLLVPYDDAKDVAYEFCAAWHDKRRAEDRLELAKNQVAALCGAAAAGGIELEDGAAIKLQSRKGQSKTYWERIAHALRVRCGLAMDEFQKLVDDNTTIGAPSTAVVAPRAWGKES